MKALTDKGLRPSHVEQELGLSNGYLATMFKRNANWGEDILSKIAKYLNFSLNYLINGSEEQKEVAKISESSVGIPLIPVEAFAGWGRWRYFCNGA